MTKEKLDGSPRLSPALDLRLFGISPSDRQPKFDKWQGKDFIGCCLYIREAIFLLRQEDTLRLIRLVGLYAGIDWQKGGVPQPLWSKKHDFTEISIKTLRETVGRHHSPRQIASSPDFQNKYPAASRHYLGDIFYYWAAVMRQIMPQLNLSGEEALKKKTTFRLGERKAGLALGRAATALSLARVIARERPLLVQLGISPTQQNLWLGALMGIPPRGYQFTDQDAKEWFRFRHYATSGPHVSLARQKTRVMIAAIPEGLRQERIRKIIKQLISHLGTAETKETKTMREPRVASLRWLRQRTKEEMAKIIGELANHPQKGCFNTIFSEKEYRPSRQYVRQGRREYSSRADPGRMAASALEMVIESLEGKGPLEILYHRHYSESTRQQALELLEKAEENLTARPNLFNNSVRRQVDNAKIKLAQLKNSELTEKEILNLLYAASNKGFFAEKFLADLRQVFNFDLLWLDESE